MRGQFFTELSRIAAENHADVTVADSTTETSLGTLAIPRDVAAGDLLVARYFGNVLNNTGGNTTNQLKVKVGATTAISGNQGALATNANRRQWGIEVVLLVANPANDLRMKAEYFLGAGGAALGTWANWQAEQTAYAQVTAENLTAGKNLDVTITLGAAAVTLEWVSHASSLQVMKKR